MQQFLADSPWEPELLVRACAERVAPEIGVTGLGRRRHRDRQGRQALAGGEAPVLGHARQDRQLPDHRLVARGRRAGDAAAGLARSICPRSGATISERRRKAKIPEQVVFQTKPRAGCGARASRRRAGRCRRRRSSPTAPTATTPLSARGCMRSSSSTCSPSPRRSASTGRRRPSRCPSATAATGRPRSVARPDRKPESVRALAERLPERAWKTLPCRTTPAGEDVASRFAFVRVVATHPVRTDHLPPR